jgi:hypothetical protein
VPKSNIQAQQIPVKIAPDDPRALEQVIQEVRNSTIRIYDLEERILALEEKVMK